MVKRQNRPPSGGSSQSPVAGGGGPPVRRAFALGAVAGDPSRLPEPAARARSGGAVPATGEEAARRLRQDTQSTVAAPAVSKSAVSTPPAVSTPAVTTSDTAAAAAEGETRDTQRVAAGRVRERTSPADVAADRRTGGPGDGAGPPAGGEPPSGKPKKSLLALATVAVSVLLVVPLVTLAATGSGHKKDNKTAAAAQTHSAHEDSQLAGPPGEDVAVSSVPRASGTPSAKGHGKTKSGHASGSAKNKAQNVPPPPVKAPGSAASHAAKSSTKEESATGTVAKAGTQSQAAPGPPAGTAAYTVLHLAQQSPGRHICYRAYVSGLGWQSVRCDGATAGTEGQQRSIKALNIAVSGTNGMAANAYIQGTGWAGQTWKAAANGTNLYLGTETSTAPNISGFAVNVDSGQGKICENAHVHNVGWLGLGCDTPASAGNYIFGGTLDATSWLEAVRFTV